MLLGETARTDAASNAPLKYTPLFTRPPFAWFSVPEGESRAQTAHCGPSLMTSMMEFKIKYRPRVNYHANRLDGLEHTWRSVIQCEDLFTRDIAVAVTLSAPRRARRRRDRTNLNECDRDYYRVL